MRYSVRYQYRPPSGSRPLDEEQEFTIAAGGKDLDGKPDGPFLAIPNIGDHVTLEGLGWGENDAMLVVENRTFSYLLAGKSEFETCLITIVLTDSPVSGARLMKD